VPRWAPGFLERAVLPRISADGAHWSIIPWATSHRDVIHWAASHISACRGDGRHSPAVLLGAECMRARYVVHGCATLLYMLSPAPFQVLVVDYGRSVLRLGGPDLHGHPVLSAMKPLMSTRIGGRQLKHPSLIIAPFYASAR
jgi:hypothetical protein